MVADLPMVIPQWVKVVPGQIFHGPLSGSQAKVSGTRRIKGDTHGSSFRRARPRRLMLPGPHMVPVAGVC